MACLVLALLSALLTTRDDDAPLAPRPDPELTLGRLAWGDLAQGDDGGARWSLVVPEASGELVVECTSTEVDVELELLDADGHVVARDADGGLGSGALLRLPAGGRARWTVVVSGTVEVSPSRYQLVVSSAAEVGEDATAEDEHAWAERLLEGTDTVGRPRLRLKGMLLMGETLDELGRHAEARTTLRSSMTLARQLEDDAVLARATCGLGVCLGHDARFEESAEQLQRAFARAQALGDLRLAARASGYLGGAFLYREGAGAEGSTALPASLVEAERHLTRAVELAVQARDPEQLAHWARQLGRTRRLMGDGRGARAAYAQALQRIDDPVTRSRVLGAMGLLAKEAADYAAAEEQLGAALELARSASEDPRRTCELAAALGSLLVFLGRADEGEPLLAEAQRLAAEVASGE